MFVAVTAVAVIVAAVVVVVAAAVVGVAALLPLLSCNVWRVSIKRRVKVD